uniref:EF-hand domain-containing protein n=1 Tax=Haptolina brevifila TaxID=156173 RepID=A0A7S2CRY1_9EUKA
MTDAKPGEAPKTGDGALEVHEFLEAVVMLAFFRANPEFGEEGKTDAGSVGTPLPECLTSMLKDNLLLNAKRDALAAVKSQLSDKECQDVLGRKKDAAKKAFEKMCKSDPATAAASKKSGVQLSMDWFCQDLFERGVIKDATVVPTSPVKGKKLPEVKISLSSIDAKGAFVTSQKVEKNNASTTINFEEFMVCLALCGSIKYGEVDKMPLPKKVESIFQNFLGEADEQKAVDLCYPPPPRFNPAVKMRAGNEVAAVTTFASVWAKMDLSHLFGFPEFEEGVYELLDKNYGELQSIFSQYAKSGTAGSVSATALQTMQKTEFFNLINDCGMISQDEQTGFTFTRVVNIFMRADQVDDTMKATKVKTLGVNKNAKAGDGSDKANVNNLSRAADRIQEVEITVMKGDSAESGDHGLKMEEFLEAIVATCLYYSNIDLGEVGHNDEVADPLPGCLEKVLEGKILKNAKRDAVAKTKASLQTDKDVQMIYPGIKKALQKSFEESTKVGVRKVFGKPVMSMEMFQQELQDRRCIKEITVDPTSMVKGQKYPPQHSNLSWLDAKGCFTTAQRGDGDEEGNSTIDFDEFVVALALCGSVKYEEIAEMTLATRFSGMVQNYLVEADEQYIISEAVVPPPPRYDTSLAKPLKGQDEAEHKALIKTWSKMDLSHVYGFPLWEEEMFGIFQRSFGELKSIFAQYAKSGSAGSGSALSAMTIQQTELTDIALDCELATDDFKMNRINNIFLRADQVDDTFQVNKSDSRAGATLGKTAEHGNNSLDMAEFFECLVMIALARANPMLGEVGHKDPTDPLPGCLDSMLQKNILVKAKRDALFKYKKMVEKDPECREALRKRSAALKAHFESACVKDATTMTGTKDQFGNVGGEVDGAGSLLGMEVFCTEMAEFDSGLPRPVTEDLTVHPTPAITGDVVPGIKSNLSWLDIKGAFVTCQNDGDGFMTFEEWCTCLGLCGIIKYENVPDDKMTLVQKVDGLYANYLGEKDCHAVISEVLQPPYPRFDPSTSSADSGFKAVWAKMDLKHIFYFPVWEKEVFELLAANHSELKLIFQQYAKSGTAGSSTAKAIFTMQKTELTNLALDCGISSSKDVDFPMVRVTNIYMRGDQVDDTEVASKADRRVKVGKGAEAGDHGLEIQEFYEVLIMLAFQKLNPKFGSVGQNTIEDVKNPLPGALETLLKSYILQKAKRDEMPALVAKIKKDPECVAAFNKNRGDLANMFVKVAGKGAQGGKLSAASAQNVDGLSLSMDDFYEEMFARNLVRDTVESSRPPVVGQVMKKYAMGLSSIDAKGAFAAAQDGSEKQKLAVGDARTFVDFDEFMMAIAVAGWIKYREVLEDGMTLGQCVEGAFDQVLGRKNEQDVLTDALFPEPPRNGFYKASKPVTTKEAHAIFIQCWEEMVITDIVGFPLWEEAVFNLLQPNFEEISAIFAQYAQSITGGKLQASTWLAVTLQENELASFCRDAGLITQEFSIARVQSLYKDLCNNSPKLKEGLNLAAFIPLLLHIALHRANPKLAGSGGVGEAVAEPLPGCFEKVLLNNVLAKAKKSKLVAFKVELQAAGDIGQHFKGTRGELKKEFERIEKKREKKALKFFGASTLTRPTIVAEFKDRNLVVIKKANPRPPITGQPPPEVEVGLSALDVESAFIQCQSGDHAADGGNDSIDIDEFCWLLALCGMVKYAAVDGMSMTQKVDGIAREFLGVASDAALVADSGPSVERYEPPSSSKLTPLWKKMDLSRVEGFPTWEEQVFGLLDAHLADLEALFAYYAGDEGLMQQTELVDLVADCALATPQFGLPKINKLFDEVNKQTGATDSDLEVYEFLQLVVQLAHASVGGGIGGGANAAAALDSLLQSNLSTSARKATVAPMLAALKEDADATGALAAANDAVQAKFATAAGSKPVDSASFIKQLAAAKVLRGCIVGDARCDLTWLDASAAFAAVGGGAPLAAADYGLAIALCGAIKYGKVAALSPAKKVAGIVANLQGAMDEHAVVAGG